MEGLFIPCAVKVSLLESCPMDAYKCQNPGKLSEGASKSLTFVRLPSMCPSPRAGPGEGAEWLVERGGGCCCCCNVSRHPRIFYFCLSSSEAGVQLWLVKGPQAALWARVWGRASVRGCTGGHTQGSRSEAAGDWAVLSLAGIGPVTVLSAVSASQPGRLEWPQGGLGLRCPAAWSPAGGAVEAGHGRSPCAPFLLLRWRFLGHAVGTGHPTQGQVTRCGEEHPPGSIRRLLTRMGVPVAWERCPRAPGRPGSLTPDRILRSSMPDARRI